MFSFFQFYFHTAPKRPPMRPASSNSRRFQEPRKNTSNSELRPNKEREKSPIQMKNEFLLHPFLFSFPIHRFIYIYIYIYIYTLPNNKEIKFQPIFSSIHCFGPSPSNYRTMKSIFVWTYLYNPCSYELK